MNKKQAKERIEELRKQVEYHAKKYYDEDKPEISDFEYDMLMVELRNLENQYPELKSKDSLTQKVGGHVKEGFQKVTHEVPLQSLQDVFSIEEVEDFDKRMQEKAKENNIEEAKYVVETKIDGLSAALEYKQGKFVRGATRGNGLVGEDVTNNLKTIKTIPKEIKDKIDITVRGEVFISKKKKKKMNQEREENEEKLFANADLSIHEILSFVQEAESNYCNLDSFFITHTGVTTSSLTNEITGKMESLDDISPTYDIPNELSTLDYEATFKEVSNPVVVGSNSATSPDVSDET